MEFGLVDSSKDKNTYRVHADDKIGVPFKQPQDVAEAVKIYMNIEYGDGVLLQTNQINPFLRAVEAMKITDYMIVPCSGEMKRFVYTNNYKDDYLYVVIKVPNNYRWRINEVNIEPRKIVD